MATRDLLGRPLRNLRLSVTDRCNLRCAYCMPEADYAWLPREDILHFEEIGRLVGVFTSLGVDRVRLTGGEPLIRRDLPELVRILAAKPSLADIAMTTNGVLLAESAADLKEAGLHRVTVSLDTLDADRFRRLTRIPALHRVLAGLDAAAAAGFPSLKIDSVVIRGVNDDELAALLERGRGWGAEVRFIEYMDVGGATRWSPEKVVSRAEILERLGRRYGPIEPVPEPESSAPAERFRLPDGTLFGIIASTTAPFCRACDRSRLTADGHWYLCLYATRGTDLRQPLRAGASDAELREILTSAWGRREDRGAEERLAIQGRAPLLPRAELTRDPHLEMHTRGG
jgi:cyclic pyranopterin phosphate synthase